MIPKILFVSAVYPHAPDYGAQQRVLNLCRLLSRMGDVTLFIVVERLGMVDQKSLDRTRAEFHVGHVARVQGKPLQGWRERLRFELDGRFINTHVGAISDDDRQTLQSLMAAHDIVWVHTLRTANECGIFRWPRTVIDVDDFPSQISISSARSSQSVMDWVLYWRRYFAWRRRERTLGERFDVATVCSDRDRALLDTVRDVHVVANGFPLPGRAPCRNLVDPPRIGFIGWLGGGPNADAVQWFCRHVWPIVKRSSPTARLRLVGGGSDRDYSVMGPDIDVLGYLPDPVDECETWRATIVPIRIGGGTRVKIAHAFSLGCPVVATTLGAFGYGAVSGQHLLIADSAADFARACESLIHDVDRGSTIARAAWEWFTAKWTWDAIEPAVRNVVNAVMEPGHRQVVAAADGSSTFAPADIVSGGHRYK